MNIVHRKFKYTTKVVMHYENFKHRSKLESRSLPSMSVACMSVACMQYTMAN